MPFSNAGSLSIIARMRCVRCHVVRYCRPNRLASFSDEMPLLLLAIRYMAIIHVQIGRCVLCIGVPAVTENRLPQSRQVNRPAE